MAPTHRMQMALLGESEANRGQQRIALRSWALKRPSGALEGRFWALQRPPGAVRIGLESGLLSTWLWHGFRNEHEDVGPSRMMKGRRVVPSASDQTNPSAVRCSSQSRGRRVSRRSLAAVRSGGCRPSRIALVMSGARKVKRIGRVK